MKKKILTLGIIIIMMLGIAKTIHAECVGFTSYCGKPAVACGETEVDRLNQASFVSWLICEMVKDEDELPEDDF